MNREQFSQRWVRMLNARGDSRVPVAKVEAAEATWAWLQSQHPELCDGAALEGAFAELAALPGGYERVGVRELLRAIEPEDEEAGPRIGEGCELCIDPRRAHDPEYVAAHAGLVWERVGRVSSRVWMCRCPSAEKRKERRSWSIGKAREERFGSRAPKSEPWPPAVPSSMLEGLKQCRREQKRQLVRNDEGSAEAHLAFWSAMAMQRDGEISAAELEDQYELNRAALLGGTPRQRADLAERGERFKSVACES